MATVTIDDPDVHKSGMKVSKNGSVHVGEKYAGKRVRIVVEVETDG